MKQHNNYSFNKHFILLFAITLSIIIIFLPPPKDMTIEAWRLSSVVILMAILWMTEAIPIYITALLPIVLFPIYNIATLKATTSPFGHPLIFLFMGGFLIAEAIQKWDLHKRIALHIIKYIGYKPKNIVAGFMIGSAFLSMWISNTATTIMMLPIGLSIISLFNEVPNLFDKDKKNLSLALLLGIAYSSSIGGIATLIGTPPNALMAAFMKDTFNYDIGFAQWFSFGIIVSIVLLPIAYYVLTSIIFPLHSLNIISGLDIEKKLFKLKKISFEEKSVLVVFVIVAVLWITRPLINSILNGVSDTSIAIFGSLILFVLPAQKKGKLLEWKDTKNIAWGILILFGGGLSLASGITNTGLSEWIANRMIFLNDLPLIALIFVITLAIIFITELSSNLATTAAFIPIIASIAMNLEINPLLLVIPSTIGASCAFMLPVATPPNAIIFSSNIISIKDMVKAGILLNLIFSFIIVIISYLFIEMIFTF